MTRSQVAAAVEDLHRIFREMDCPPFPTLASFEASLPMGQPELNLRIRYLFEIVHAGGFARLPGIKGAGASPNAHARRTDPQTSHDAAASAGVTINQSRAHVLKAYEFEALADRDLVEVYRGPKQSPSGLRTRRSELEKSGYLSHAGQMKGYEGESTTHRVFEITPRGVNLLKVLRSKGAI